VSPPVQGWAVELRTSQIVSVTTSGVVREYAVPNTVGTITDLAAGPDGNVWFTSANGVVSRITPAGVLTHSWHPDRQRIPAGSVRGPRWQRLVRRRCEQQDRASDSVIRAIR